SFAFSRTRHPPPSTLFPYTTLFRSSDGHRSPAYRARAMIARQVGFAGGDQFRGVGRGDVGLSLGRQHGHGLGLAERVRVDQLLRSEEHTSELQSLAYLVCRLLLEKK